MVIRAVVFDIGGVLEITPPVGRLVTEWETQLHLQPGELDERLRDVWQDGSVGTISEAEVETSVGAILGLDQAQVDSFMADLWTEYLGELNVELAAYFAGLRPRYQTAILSNSFVGARRKEQERYGFAEMCDLIIRSGILIPPSRTHRSGFTPGRTASPVLWPAARCATIAPFYHSAPGSRAAAMAAATVANRAQSSAEAGPT